MFAAGPTGASDDPMGGKQQEAEAEKCEILVRPHTYKETPSPVETVPDVKCEMILEIFRDPFTDDLCVSRRASRRPTGKARPRRGGCYEAHGKWKNIFLR